MKHTILDLKKKVLVVETLDEKLACVYFFNKYGFDFMNKMKFICNGSEITKEICKNLIELIPISEGASTNDALESFKSAIEANGFHWLENPLGDIEKQFVAPEGMKWKDHEKQWQQAEEKTFRNCLLFEII